MIAAAVQPGGANGQECPFSGWRATGEMPVTPGPSAEEFPVAYELTFDQFSKLMEERVESWACR